MSGDFGWSNAGERRTVSRDASTNPGRESTPSLVPPRLSNRGRSTGSTGASLSPRSMFRRLVALAEHAFDNVRGDALQPSVRTCQETERGKAIQSARAAAGVEMQPGHGAPAENRFATAGRGQLGRKVGLCLRT